MELHEFKNLIESNKIMQETITEYETINKDSTTPLRKIEKNLKSEMLLSIILASVCFISVFFIEFLFLKVIALLFAVICFEHILQIKRLNKKINELYSSTQNIKVTLERAISIIKRYCKLYLVVTITLSVFIILSGFSFYFLSADSMLSIDEQVRWSNRPFIFYVGFCLVVLIFQYFFVMNYLSNRFGHYLREMKSTVAELESI